MRLLQDTARQDASATFYASALQATLSQLVNDASSKSRPIDMSFLALLHTSCLNRMLAYFFRISESFTELSARCGLYASLIHLCRTLVTHPDLLSMLQVEDYLLAPAAEARPVLSSVDPVALPAAPAVTPVKAAPKVSRTPIVPLLLKIRKQVIGLVHVQRFALF